jgi:DNA polymerase-3 subunit epsilon
MRQIVFDLETTGFKFEEGHRIVEIGAIELNCGAVTGRSFHTYVNPERDVPEGAYQVHGLTTEFLKDKPVFADPRAAPAFLDFAQDSELIAHNGLAFDLPFLNAELAAARLATFPVERMFDTLPFARRKYPGAPASLDALCAKFGIDTRERMREGHGALLDSRLLAAVYVELTGGAQAGLRFDDAPGRRMAGAAPVAALPPRPRALAPLITDEEARLHAEFIRELGAESLWAKFAA